MRTSKFHRGLAGLALLASSAVASPAFAQEEEASPPVTITGSVGLVSDYRFRGVSQSDEGVAVQGGFTVNHESGFYAGTWASNLAGWGTFGGPNLELDIFTGYTKTFDATTIDVGVTWYMYPNGFDETDFFEGYAKLKGTAGPATLTAAVYYAPKQNSLSNVSNTPFSRGQNEDNLYLVGREERDFASGLGQVGPVSCPWFVRLGPFRGAQQEGRPQAGHAKTGSAMR